MIDHVEMASNIKSVGRNSEHPWRRSTERVKVEISRDQRSLGKIVSEARRS